MKFNFGNMTLGEIIEALKRCRSDAWIHFDFGDLSPTNFDSYRGFYEQLAVGFESRNEFMRVSEFLKKAEDAVGQTMCGWKGGEYLMQADTPVWVANPGRATSTAVCGITDHDYFVVIDTKYISV